MSARSRNRLWKMLAAFALFLAVGLAPALAQPGPTARQLKAAFICNFPRYVEWPAGTFATTNSPLVFAVLGDSQLEEELKKAISGKSVGGHPMVLRHLSEGDEPLPCHILFVSASQQNRAQKFIEQFNGASVLTVGETDDFLDDGGVVSLTQLDRKIGLEINLAPARRAHLTLSTGLLNVARTVKGKDSP